MTLVELAVVLAIIAVVSGFLVPGFKTLMQDRRFNTASSEVTRVVILARSEAMKRGDTIFITAIDGSDTTNEWARDSGLGRMNLAILYISQIWMKKFIRSQG